MQQIFPLHINDIHTHGAFDEHAQDNNYRADGLGTLMDTPIKVSMRFTDTTTIIRIYRAPIHNTVLTWDGTVPSIHTDTADTHPPHEWVSAYHTYEILSKTTFMARDDILLHACQTNNTTTLTHQLQALLNTAANHETYRRVKIWMLLMYRLSHDTGIPVKDIHDTWMNGHPPTSPTIISPIISLIDQGYLIYNMVEGSNNSAQWVQSAPMHYWLKPGYSIPRYVDTHKHIDTAVLCATAASIDIPMTHTLLQDIEYNTVDPLDPAVLFPDVHEYTYVPIHPHEPPAHPATNSLGITLSPISRRQEREDGRYLRYTQQGYIHNLPLLMTIDIEQHKNNTQSASIHAQVLHEAYIPCWDGHTLNPRGPTHAYITQSIIYIHTHNTHIPAYTTGDIVCLDRLIPPATIITPLQEARIAIIAQLCAYHIDDAYTTRYHVLDHGNIEHIDTHTPDWYAPGQTKTPTWKNIYLALQWAGAHGIAYREAHDTTLWKNHHIKDTINDIVTANQSRHSMHMYMNTIRQAVAMGIPTLPK